MKKCFLLLALLIAAYVGWSQLAQETNPAGLSDQNVKTPENAYKLQNNDVQVEGEGIVIKVLPDDNDGSRHQRFILKLRSGLTLLIAHNIDLAKRISPLKKGDSVQFNGEYEWNSKGGVVHWTHRDPNGRHVAGWLKHKGQIYQ